MNDIAQPERVSAPTERTLRYDPANAMRYLTGQHTYIIVVAVLLISLWITAGSISQSYLIGKLASPSTHNDVNYLIDGIRRLLFIEINGFWAEVSRIYTDLMHAPLSGYQAALGYYLFGFYDWAPYATDIVYVLIFLSVCAWLLRGNDDLIVIACLLAMAGMPLLASSISEFAPEMPCGLFTSIGVLLTIRINSLDRALRQRILAGFCLGLGFLAKPSSFAFVPLVTCAALGLAFIRDVILTKQLRRIGRATYLGVFQLILMLWLPALYVIPWWGHYSEYFYLAEFDPANVKAFGGNLNIAQHALFYLTGAGAEYIFGNFLWAYVTMIALGLAAASWRQDRDFIGRQFELLLLVIIMWIAPTLAPSKNTLFGAPFAFVLAFMVVMALRSIYETLGPSWGAAAVSLLGLFLFVSPTSRYYQSNTPGFDWVNPNAHVVREKWIEAMDRFTTVILNNSPTYQAGTVYITNPGYYHIPVLWYAFLKKDPSLEWTFNSIWTDPEPQHHIDYIHETKQDFVIAGQRGNGLTYAPTLIEGAAASENVVYAAMWKDPDYMPIDEFYGPSGRTIAIFQRRKTYAGWRPLSGLQNGGTAKSWRTTGPVVYLQAYAPIGTPAELAIDASGPPGQQIDIVINRQTIANIKFDSSGNASVDETFELARGQNDIVLQNFSAAPVEFKRLLVIRKLTPEG